MPFVLIVKSKNKRQLRVHSGFSWLNFEKKLPNLSNICAKQESPPALTRKRHTDRCIASPRYAVLVGGGGGGTWPGPAGGGYPGRGGTLAGGGYPGQGGGYPGQGGTLVGGVPWLGGGGVPIPAWIGTPPPGCGQTDKLKILPPLVLRTRSVKMVLEPTICCIKQWNSTNVLGGHK